MSPRFRTKKLRVARDIGLILRRRRESQGFSLEQVEAKTNIRTLYLSALESGEHLPLHGVYLLGFVRQYAEFLGFEGETLARRFTEQRQTQLISSQLKFSPSRLPRRRVIELSPRRLLFFGFVTLMGVGLSLLFLQIWRFSTVPYLKLEAPQDRFVTTSSGEVELRGRVENHQAVLIQSQPIVTTPEGNFAETLHFDPGVTTVELLVKGRRGKDFRRLITVSVPQAAASQTTQ